MGSYCERRRARVYGRDLGIAKTRRKGAPCGDSRRRLHSHTGARGC